MLRQILNGSFFDNACMGSAFIFKPME